MFWIFVCLTAAGAFGAGMVLAQARLRVPPAGGGRVAGALAAPARTGDAMEDLLELGAGDVVVHMGVDHLVAAVERYTGEGVLLLVGRLESNDEEAIVVTNTPRPVALLANALTAHHLPAVLPDVVQHAGLTWRRQRRMELKQAGGAATVVHLFEGPDHHQLVALQVQGGMQLFQGRAMQPDNVMVLRAR